MREQIKIFLTAIMFYTRIPCPSWVDHSPEYINKSVRYFPLVGWIVGGISGVGWISALSFINQEFAAVIFLAISVLLTGAFHEDGFADTCDGFGGGWTKEQVLQIMKDSRVGTYGLVGTLLLILAKVFLLSDLGEWNHMIMLLIIVINGHALSRLMAATVIFTHSYVREDEKTKAKPVAKSYTITNALFAGFFGLLPSIILVFLTQQWLWLMIPPLIYLVKMYLGHLFNKRLGGYTGDCLGATQQITEVAFYLLVLILWKFT